MDSNGAEDPVGPAAPMRRVGRVVTQVAAMRFSQVKAFPVVRQHAASGRGAKVSRFRMVPAMAPIQTSRLALASS